MTMFMTVYRECICLPDALSGIHMIESHRSCRKTSGNTINKATISIDSNKFHSPQQNGLKMLKCHWLPI